MGIIEFFITHPNADVQTKNKKGNWEDEVLGPLSWPLAQLHILNHNLSAVASGKKRSSATLVGVAKRRLITRMVPAGSQTLLKAEFFIFKM